MQVILNGLNLNTGNYLTKEVVFDSSPPIEFSDMGFASSDGAKFISSKYTPKSLTIRGRISQSTVALLEAEMDNFKKTLQQSPNINLNFSYANGFRQYVGNVQNLTLTREKFHVTYCPFEITFIAEDPPFAQEISAIDSVQPNLNEVFSSDAVIGNTYSHTLTMSGTAPPLAKWTYMLDAVSGKVEQVVFKSLTTGKQMEINSALSAGDQLIIDQEEMDVFQNMQERDYEGVFPTFNLGGNELEFQIYGSGTMSQSGIAIDQSQVVYTNYWSAPMGWSSGQTFTPSVTKTFKKISVVARFGQWFNPAQDIYLRIWTTSSGKPSTVLETVKLRFGSNVINTIQWIDFAITQNLTAGTVYAFDVYSESGIDFALGSTTNLYSGGTALSNENNTWLVRSSYDLAFKTYYEHVSGGSAFDHTSSLKVEQHKRFL